MNSANEKPFLTKNNLFYGTAIVTGITLISFVMANYKYTNFLLTNVNMIYISSLILGLVLTGIAFSYEKTSPVGTQQDITQQDITQKDITQPLQKTPDEVNIELINKYSNIYQLVFEILTIDAIIAHNRTVAFNTALGYSKGKLIATIENIRKEMSTITAIKLGRDDKESENVEKQLKKLSKLIDTIKLTLDTNIIVALQLIYDVDTRNSPLSTKILHQAKTKAILNLSKVQLSSMKPDNNNKYFDKDVHREDYDVLGIKLNELNIALSNLLDPKTKEKYEDIADSIQSKQYILGDVKTQQIIKVLDKMNRLGNLIIKSLPEANLKPNQDLLTSLTDENKALFAELESSNRNFKDLISLKFTDGNEGGIRIFMDELLKIIQEIKDA